MNTKLSVVTELTEYKENLKMVCLRQFAQYDNVISAKIAIAEFLLRELLEDEENVETDKGCCL